MIGRCLIRLIRFYQRYLSPLKQMPSCRFVPTCSSYAIEAITQRGVAIGLAKATWRLLRCNPLFPGGYDPVEPLKPDVCQLCQCTGREPVASGSDHVSM